MNIEKFMNYPYVLFFCLQWKYRIEQQYSCFPESWISLISDCPLDFDTKDNP